ncbi:MAG: capsule biosynthesis protein CapA [Pseudomonadota bacterium]
MRHPFERSTPQTRVFLFLQGPHGPAFFQLGCLLERAGAQVWRVGFNAGDRFFWRDAKSYIGFNKPQSEWSTYFRDLVARKGISDLIVYGDTRPVHTQAIEEARSLGLTIHVFEEGYLRPYWITYERGGANGHSRLMKMSVAEMREKLAQSDTDTALPPASWGDMRQHVFYGALYHGLVLLAGRKYPYFKPHRAMSVRQEFNLYLKRFLLMPLHAVERQLASRRIRRGGFPYHLVLLQLEHDASFCAHSKFATMSDFLEIVLRGFAQGAPTHHHLVVKAHPLEDGRTPIRSELRKLIRRFGLTDRVHYVRGGKLAQLLDETRSAVTVNSTAAQQVLWRGIPLKIFGQAVYDKPEFVSSLPLPSFFARAARPDRRAYRDFRRYLLETSQVPGGFYAARSRRQFLRQAVDMLLAGEDPYDALAVGSAALRQQLQLIK